MKKKLIYGAVFAAACLVSGTTWASGFALIEQSGSALGNAYAGAAASAEDASTIFFNPAGLTRLEGNQLVFAGHMVKPSAKFSNSASVAATSQTLGGTGGDAGDWAAIPNFYASMQAADRLYLGLALNAPFGLQTEYDADWMGRFQAIKSKVETLNFNPSIAYRADNFSIGGGVNYQYIKGTLTSAVNYSAAAGGALGANVQGTSEVKGSDYAWGYNLGILFNPSDKTRVGLAYRSSIKYTLEGNVTFSNRPAALAAAIPDEAVTLDIKMPETFSASLFHQVNNQWDILADVTWTGWSVFDRLKVVRSSGATLIDTPENWQDTWRYSIGANHHYNDAWTVRVGVAYDQTPVKDEYRTARVPDSDRTWLSLGGQYKPSKNNAIDFGYTHIFMDDASINDRQNAIFPARGDLVGSYENSVDILSLQYRYSF